MKYKVIDNFLDENSCNQLINEAEKFAKNEHIKVLNERQLLPSTSFAFINLVKKSQAWSSLQSKLNSSEFLNLLTDSLDIKDTEFKITNFFYNLNPSTFLKRYKDLNSKKISMIGNINLIFYLSYKFYRSLIRFLKYKFRNKDYVELLYDYSKSPNGYKREIHRDSDSRTIVFLLYLNKLSDQGEGGDLELYKYNNNQNKIPSRPKESDCTLIERVTPKSGRLVTFVNSHDSLHAVSEMKNHNGYRHFLYGSFTLLGKKNKLLVNSSGSLRTNFSIFD